MAGWTARALARILNLAPSTVIQWIESGLVTPESYGRGRGGHNIGIAGLLELTAIIELRQAGISTQAIRSTVNNLRALSGQEGPLARLTLLISGGDIYWKDADELSNATISVLRKPGQRLMILPVGERHADLLQQLQDNQKASTESSFSSSLSVR